MWIFLNDGYLSIVSHRDRPGVMPVRARRAGNIEAMYPDTWNWVDKQADYPHRAELSADQAAQAHQRMTRVARCTASSGIVSPMALALRRLITSSMGTSVSTGSSPALAPLRILSTSTAARRPSPYQLGP